MLMDRTGVASGGGPMSACDLARRRNAASRRPVQRQQIVPATVVADIAGGADPAKFAVAGYATLPNWSYHDMWWVSDQGYYMARGIYGQAIYVDPKSQLVVARFGSHPLASNVNQDPIILPAYRAIAQYLEQADRH